MKSELPIRLVLVNPPPDIDYAVQRGSGSQYEPVLVQRRTRPDVVFDFEITVSDNRKDGAPNFTGPFVQGPPGKRFIYIDVGTYAGQKNTAWSRRMIVPLSGITWPMIRKVLGDAGQRLSVQIPGTGKDGGPTCATVTFLGDWTIVNL